ncbi:unnamed protein product [Prorocentrum cordatum]|uniref:Uncharacterized protein n=1 Tax=Prorocentrum cordatum TaxID=2364126 RepID=A0ABN9Q422_9DINO|nr:unnamed protein product [Polarella glacialis]
MRTLEGRLSEAVSRCERLQSDPVAQRGAVQKLSDDLAAAETNHKSLVHELHLQVEGGRSQPPEVSPPTVAQVTIEDILDGKQLPTNLDSLLAPETETSQQSIQQHVQQLFGAAAEQASKFREE